MASSSITLGWAAATAAGRSSRQVWPQPQAQAAAANRAKSAMAASNRAMIIGASMPNHQVPGLLGD
jgi:hypothetical protein